MTEADLLAALRDATAPEAGGEGLTTQELIEATGLPAARIRKSLHALVKADRVRVSEKLIPNLAGKMQWRPSFVFLKE